MAFWKVLKGLWTDVWCYEKMKAAGVATSRQCKGIVVYDSSAGFESYGCTSCPYWTPAKEKNNEKTK